MRNSIYALRSILNDAAHQIGMAQACLDVLMKRGETKWKHPDGAAILRLELSARAYNALVRSNIVTWGQAREIGENMHGIIKGVGLTTSMEIDAIRWAVA